MKETRELVAQATFQAAVVVAGVVSMVAVVNAVVTAVVVAVVVMGTSVTRKTVVKILGKTPGN